MLERPRPFWWIFHPQQRYKHRAAPNLITSRISNTWGHHCLIHSMTSNAVKPRQHACNKLEKIWKSKLDRIKIKVIQGMRWEYLIIWLGDVDGYPGFPGANKWMLHSTTIEECWASAGGITRQTNRCTAIFLPCQSHSESVGYSLRTWFLRDFCGHFKEGFCVK